MCHDTIDSAKSKSSSNFVEIMVPYGLPMGSQLGIGTSIVDNIISILVSVIFLMVLVDFIMQN